MRVVSLAPRLARAPREHRAVSVLAGEPHARAHALSAPPRRRRLPRLLRPLRRCRVVSVSRIRRRAAARRDAAVPRARALGILQVLERAHGEFLFFLAARLFLDAASTFDAETTLGICFEDRASRSCVFRCLLAFDSSLYNIAFVLLFTKSIYV